MSDKYNVYRAYAAFCERMSRESADDARKLSWMQLAADWLALIHDSSAADAVSELPKDKGTEPADGHAQRDHAPDPAESAPDR